MIPTAGRWIHAREEDVGDVRTYRPEATPLPLSRAPRSVLEFAADGSFASLTAGPADRRVRRAGRWEATPDQRLRVIWDDGGETAVLQLVESAPEILRLRPLQGSLD